MSITPELIAAVALAMADFQTEYHYSPATVQIQDILAKRGVTASQAEIKQAKEIIKSMERHVDDVKELPELDTEPFPGTSER